MFKPSDEATSSQTYNPQHTTPDEVETVVGPSVVVEGDFASEGNILVKGTVSGSVKTGRLLTVEEGARILANVRAGEALISGEVKGNMQVVDQLELTESARVMGDISCRVLVIAGGAQIEGHVSMGTVTVDGPTKERKQSRRTRVASESSEEGEE